MIKLTVAIKKPELYNLILSGKYSETLSTPLHQSFFAKGRHRTRNKGGKKPRISTIIRRDERFTVFSRNLVLHTQLPVIC